MGGQLHPSYIRWLTDQGTLLVGCQRVHAHHRVEDQVGTVKERVVQPSDDIMLS
jgi:hypothetical protein